MPIYVYRNLTTGETFEVQQRMTDAALSQHPETGDPVKRLIQPVGIAFKGSGFYVTDSRSSNGASKPAGNGDRTDKADKADAKGSESSASTKGSEGSSGAAADKASKGESKSESKGESKGKGAAGSSSGS